MLICIELLMNLNFHTDIPACVRKFWRATNEIYLYLHYYFVLQAMFLPFKPKQSLFLNMKTYFLHCKPSYRLSTWS